MRIITIMVNYVVVSARLISDTVYDRLVRWEANTIITNFLLLVGFHFSFIDVFIRMGFTIFANFLAYFINDFIDVETDILSKNKNIKKATYLKQNKNIAFLLIVFLSILLLLLSLLYSTSVGFGVALVLLVIYIYTKYLKKMPYLDVVGCFFWGIALPWIAIPNFNISAIKLIVLLGIFSSSTEIIQTIKDYESDKRLGIKTTAVALGIRKSFVGVRILCFISFLYTMFVIQSWVGIILLIPLFLRTSQDVSVYWMKIRFIFGIVWLLIMAQVFIG